MIVLVGVDGSGKTTAARRLAQELTAGGTPARYFENGGGRPVIDALAHRLGRRDGRHLLGPRRYLAIEATIRWVAMARALVLSTLTRRVAVMDRYTYCQYAIMRARGDTGPTDDPNLQRPDGEASRHDHPRGRDPKDKRTGERAEGLVRLLYLPFPRPDVTCYLTVPPDEAARRVQARGRDVEDPAYLAAFAAAYRSLPEFADFTVCDASADAESVASSLKIAVTAVIPHQES